MDVQDNLQNSKALEKYYKLMPNILNILTMLEIKNKLEDLNNLFNKNYLIEVNKQIKEYIKEINFDFGNLDLKTAKALGFKKLDKDSNLYYIPLWLFPMLPKDTIVVREDGMFVRLSNIYFTLPTIANTGCIPYGFLPKEK